MFNIRIPVLSEIQNTGCITEVISPNTAFSERCQAQLPKVFLHSIKNSGFSPKGKYLV